MLNYFNLECLLHTTENIELKLDFQSNCNHIIAYEKKLVTLCICQKY